MSERDFELDLDELNTAEDFLEYFDIDYDQSVVHVNRLHILQRFHDYLGGVDVMPEDEVEKREIYANLLSCAYADFVTSDARTERVFKVFHMHEPVKVEIPLTDLTRKVSTSAP